MRSAPNVQDRHRNNQHRRNQIGAVEAQDKRWWIGADVWLGNPRQVRNDQIENEHQQAYEKKGNNIEARDENPEPRSAQVCPGLSAPSFATCFSFCIHTRRLTYPS